jgi:hypothetical protein
MKINPPEPIALTLILRNIASPAVYISIGSSLVDILQSKR